jgi:tetratricopeptide (TPR) repeat protein
MGWRVIAAAVLLAGTATARADELRPPQNVNAEPWSRQSSELATRAAKAEMQGMPRESAALAEDAMRANPQDPWPYYLKGMALARLGQTDAAVASMADAEQRFSPTDRWGRSIAIYGRANTYAQAGRCGDARQAFDQYAAFVAAQAPDAASQARRYAKDCRGPATPPNSPSSSGATEAPSSESPATTTTPAPPADTR